MKIYASGRIDATDAIRIHNHGVLGMTSLTTGDLYSDELYVTGSITHRADWLRRLADAATQAADELDAGPGTHRDDAMNRRCNSCERLARQCVCVATGEQVA